MATEEHLIDYSDEELAPDESAPAATNAKNGNSKETSTAKGSYVG